MVRGDGTANGRRDRGASMVLLIGGLVIMGIMAVIVLKVVQNQNDDTVNTLKDVKSAAGEVTTPPSAPGPGGATTTAQNMIGAAQAQECVVEKQTVEQAEEVGSTLESRPLNTDELVMLRYLKETPAHYEVVVNPDGTTTVRSKAPTVCP